MGNSDRITWNGWAARISLCAASLAVTYLVLELVVFRFLLPHLPLRLHAYLPDAARILAQSSKASAVPRRYVALTGDSYAQGLGDWLLGADSGRNPPFHSAHVIADRTGRDVVTFASGGAGSLTGIALKPISSLDYLESSRLYGFPTPDDLLVYFYAGNDLEDTLMELGVLWPPDSGPVRPGPARDAWYAELGRGVLRDDGSFAEAAQKTLLPRYGSAFDVRSFSPSEHLFFARFVAALLRGEPPIPLWQRRHKDGALVGSRAGNPVRVGGTVEQLPGEVQGPALDLTPAETNIALLALERSVGYLRAALARTRICLVYIPAPVSCYALDSESVRVQPFGGREGVHTAARVRSRSDQLERRVAAVAARHGLRHVDSRPPLREEAARRLIHGPRDWNHFNRAGYTVLGEAALGCLQTSAAP
jgi:hypothetical protein